MSFERGQHGHVADAEAKVIELAATMNVAEIARETGVSEPTVRKLLNEHELEAVQVVDPRVIARRFDNLAEAQLRLAEQMTDKALQLVAEDVALAKAEADVLKVGEDADKPFIAAKDRTDRLRAIQAVVQASGVAVDKASLLSGRATERRDDMDSASFADAQRLLARVVQQHIGSGPKPKAIDAKVVE